jgi:hypothetical protein
LLSSSSGGKSLYGQNRRILGKVQNTSNKGGEIVALALSDAGMSAQLEKAAAADSSAILSSPCKKIPKPYERIMGPVKYAQFSRCVLHVLRR